MLKYIRFFGKLLAMKENVGHSSHTSYVVDWSPIGPN